MIRAEWLRTYNELDRSFGGQIVQSWDTASKDGVLNDWSVCITALVRRGNVFIIDVWRRKVGFPDLKKAAIENARRHGGQVLMIEDQASGTQLLQILFNEQPHGVPRPIARKPEADKCTRPAAVSAQIEAGQLLLPREAPWLGGFKQELLAFPSARHDDQVDALSQLLIWVGLQQRSTGPAIAGPLIYCSDSWEGGDDGDFSFDPLY